MKIEDFGRTECGDNFRYYIGEKRTSWAAAAAVRIWNHHFHREKIHFSPQKRGCDLSFRYLRLVHGLIPRLIKKNEDDARNPQFWVHPCHLVLVA